MNAHYEIESLAAWLFDDDEYDDDTESCFACDGYGSYEESTVTDRGIECRTVTCNYCARRS